MLIFDALPAHTGHVTDTPLFGNASMYLKDEGPTEDQENTVPKYFITHSDDSCTKKEKKMGK